MELYSETQNKKGNAKQSKSSLGYTYTSYGDNNFISVDAYEGQGSSYKERSEPEIKIVNEGEIIFTGTIEELKNKLKNA